MSIVANLTKLKAELDPIDVRLIAVSKTKPIEALKEAYIAFEKDEVPLGIIIGSHVGVGCAGAKSRSIFIFLPVFFLERKCCWRTSVLPAPF